MKYKISFALLLITLFSHNVYASETVTNNMLAFFQALKSGDITAIQSYIGGNLEKNYRTLLQKNKTYPEFLRKHYNGAQIKINRLINNGENITVDTTIVFPNSDTNHLFFIFEKDVNSNWKIVGQIEKP